MYLALFPFLASVFCVRYWPCSFVLFMLVTRVNCQFLQPITLWCRHLFWDGLPSFLVKTPLPPLQSEDRRIWRIKKKKGRPVNSQSNLPTSRVRNGKGETTTMMIVIITVIDDNVKSYCIHLLLSPPTKTHPMAFVICYETRSAGTGAIFHRVFWFIIFIQNKVRMRLNKRNTYIYTYVSVYKCISG